MKRTFDDGYVLEYGTEALDPMMLLFGAGSADEFEALCLPGRSLTACIVGEGEERVGILATAFDEAAGTFIPLTAGSLRHLATGLARMADELDGGKGKQ